MRHYLKCHLKDFSCVRMHVNLIEQYCVAKSFPDLKELNSSLELDLFSPIVGSWLLTEGHFDKSRHLRIDLFLLKQSLLTHYSLNA